MNNNKERNIIPLLKLSILALLVIFGSKYVDSATSFKPLTKGYADTLYCSQHGNCNVSSLSVENLTVTNYINATVVSFNVTGNMFFNGNVTINGSDLDVYSDTEFHGNFSTPCLHCEDGDIYFHGDGSFEGNVTAPNIEVMESLIVHGNSTCTGTATKCSDIDNSILCGWTTWSGQRGCRWRWGASDCVGTATPCNEMSTATCEQQHVCTLTEGSAGFIIDGFGLNGTFNINTSGYVDAGNISIDGQDVNDVFMWTNGTNAESEVEYPIGTNINLDHGILRIDSGRMEIEDSGYYFISTASYLDFRTPTLPFGYTTWKINWYDEGESLVFDFLSGDSTLWIKESLKVDDDISIGNKLIDIDTTKAYTLEELNRTPDNSSFLVNGTHATFKNLTIDGMLTVGEDDTGHDVKFYGATSGSYMLWDESEDNLKVSGTAEIISGSSDQTGFKIDGRTNSLNVNYPFEYFSIKRRQGGSLTTYPGFNTKTLGAFELDDDTTYTTEYTFAGLKHTGATFGLTGGVTLLGSSFGHSIEDKGFDLDMDIAYSFETTNGANTPVTMSGFNLNMAPGLTKRSTGTVTGDVSGMNLVVNPYYQNLATSKTTGLKLTITHENDYADTAYGIWITGISGAIAGYGIYDESGADWWLKSDDQSIQFGATATDLEIESDGTRGLIKSTAGVVFDNKVIFTQTDGNEFIDSLNDGYMDYGATTGHRFNNIIDITTTTDPQLRLTHTDGVDETDFYTNSDGELEIMPTARTLYLGDGTAGDATFGFYGDTSVYTLIHDDSESDLKVSANDATNYMKFASDGLITLHGTARVIKEMWIGSNGIKAPGSKPATFVENGLTGCWEFADAIEANQESVSGTIKIPTDMDKTVAPTFNIGWHADGISPGNCKWQFEYLWVSPNEDVTAAAQETLTVVSTASATSNGLVIAEIIGIDLPSATDKAMFWKLTRLSSDVQDTISDVTHLRGEFFKYTSNKLGKAT